MQRTGGAEPPPELQSVDGYEERARKAAEENWTKFRTMEGTWSVSMNFVNYNAKTVDGKVLEIGDREQDEIFKFLIQTARDVQVG
ncbi:hypothetical protein [Nocardia otitidiscaviarum]|uniref:hypothetical protein n=1 Tax=Nocardia otitidiscaviarum TaxID=1823 RepID=UPI0024537E04|nr:hypothetical protein [Nocardia otitidiscaviarum]